MVAQVGVRCDFPAQIITPFNPLWTALDSQLPAVGVPSFELRFKLLDHRLRKHLIGPVRRSAVSDFELLPAD